MTDPFDTVREALNYAEAKMREHFDDPKPSLAALAALASIEERLRELEKDAERGSTYREMLKRVEAERDDWKTESQIADEDKRELYVRAEAAERERDEAQEQLRLRRKWAEAAEQRVAELEVALREIAENARSAYGVAEQGGAKEIARAALATSEQARTPAEDKP